MKEIRAVIPPMRLDAVHDALREIPNFDGMTVSRVQGAGFHRRPENSRDVKGQLPDYAQRMLIQIVAEDELVEPILAAIHKAAHTGRPGDGVVWVIDVASFHRLRVPVHEAE